MEKLRLNIAGIKNLKEKHGIDILKGSEINFNDPEIIADIFTYGSAHWDKPPTIEEVTNEYDFFDVIKAVQEMLTNGTPKKKAVPKPAKKRAKVKRN